MGMSVLTSAALIAVLVLLAAWAGAVLGWLARGDAEAKAGKRTVVNVYNNGDSYIDQDGDDDGDGDYSPVEPAGPRVYQPSNN